MRLLGWMRRETGVGVWLEAADGTGAGQEWDCSLTHARAVLGPLAREK